MARGQIDLDGRIPEDIGGLPIANEVPANVATVYYDPRRDELRWIRGGVIDSATLSDRSATGRRLMNAARPRIASLITGQDHEVFAVVNCTQSADTVNFKIGDRGHKFAIAGASTATAILDPVGAADPVTLDPIPSAIGLWVFVTAKANVTSITVNIYSDSDASVSWNASLLQAAITDNGWTLIRWPGHTSTQTAWGTIYRARVIVVATGPVDVTVGHLWAEQNPKGQVILVADGFYDTFRTTAYPELKKRGIPVTFAPDMALFGASSGITLRGTLAALRELMVDGNGNECSFHGHSGDATATMTAGETRADTAEAIQFLGYYGLSEGAMWRAAWPNNDAPEADKTRGMLLAYGTPSSSSGMDIWPPSDRWNIPRTAIHGVDAATMDTHFSRLSLLHEFGCFYMHGIDAGGGTHATPAEFAYWLAKIDALRADIEFVTMGQLLARGGITHRAGFGDWSTNYIDALGASTSVRLP